MQNKAVHNLLGDLLLFRCGNHIIEFSASLDKRYYFLEAQTILTTKKPLRKLSGFIYLNEYYSSVFSSVESAASALGSSTFSSALGASATTASFLAVVALLLLLVAFFSSALGL